MLYFMLKVFDKPQKFSNKVSNFVEYKILVLLRNAILLHRFIIFGYRVIRAFFYILKLQIQTLLSSFIYLGFFNKYT